MSFLDQSQTEEKSSHCHGGLLFKFYGKFLQARIDLLSYERSGGRLIVSSSRVARSLAMICQG